MGRRRDFPWGRWIRVDVAHHYLSVDRRWFNQNIRPFVLVMSISKQAKAIPRADIDARAQQIEDQFRKKSEEPTASIARREDTKIAPKPTADVSPARSRRQPAPAPLRSQAKGHGRAERVLAKLHARLEEDALRRK